MSTARADDPSTTARHPASHPTAINTPETDMNDQNDQQSFDEFLEAVEKLRDDEPIRITAHTSNAATETWLPQSADAPGTHSSSTS